MSHFNIPLFKEFDFYNKYNKIQNSNIIFIKLRFNEINNWSNILSNIFDKKIIMHNDNLSYTKETIDIYNKFKEKYKVPLSYLFNLDKDKEFKVYTTQDEKINYLKYWMKKSFDDINIKNNFI
jgi:hypothetical protein